MHPAAEPRQQPVMAGLTTEQAKAAAQYGPVLVLAGAGTGKTKTLTAAVVHRIAAGGVAPGRVLAVTRWPRSARRSGPGSSTSDERQRSGDARALYRSRYELSRLVPEAAAALAGGTPLQSSATARRATESSAGRAALAIYAPS